VKIKNSKDLDTLREGGKRLAGILREVAKEAVPGINTKRLDTLAEELILKAGGKPSFKGYKVRGAPIPYPGSLCVSVNEEVVHGIPSNRVLKAGDVVGLDIGMQWPEVGGLFTDTATTIIVGDDLQSVAKLVNSTKEALDIGISQVKDGVKLGDVGHAIQEYLEGQKLGVVRELVGHGVGRKVHEDPEIPNWGRLGTGQPLKEGMVVALEPMATLGDYRVKLAPDGWAWLTKDGSLSAHFEHTIVVTKTGAEVLTQSD
jgi:methionyl aminopeptidase